MNIGGSRGGAAGMWPPPTGSISFIFAYVFAKKCIRWRSLPPPMGWHPPTGNSGSATDEDIILKEENPEIYMHLENVLVHMINTQDVAIFESQKDYMKNKQKLLEYIHYTQNWQVLSVIFSYVAFTCDIILVLTLIVFFIR